MTRAATVAVALALALAAVAVPAAPAGATLLVNETFSHATADNPNWLVGGLVNTKSVSPCLTAGTNTSQSPIPGCPANQPAIPGGGDPGGQGALRLTSNTGNNTGFVLYQAALPFTAGLDLTFSFYDYDSVPTSVGTGADGSASSWPTAPSRWLPPGCSGAAWATLRPPIRSRSAASSAATLASGSTSGATSAITPKGAGRDATNPTAGSIPTT